MKVKISKYHIFWIVARGFAFAFLLYRDWVIGGSVTYIKDFSKNQFEISYVFPLGRTRLEKTYQTLIGEPVYFTLYSPQKFEQAHVRLRLAHPVVGWSIGYQTAPGFHYETVSMPSDATDPSFNFTISHAYRKNNRLQFILSSPGGVREPLIINELNITLERDEHSLTEYLREWKANLKVVYERIF